MMQKNTAVLILTTLCLVSHALPTPKKSSNCLTIGLISEFKRPTGSFDQPFGNQIKRGAQIAKEFLASKPKSICVDYDYLDINNSYANIPDKIRLAAKKGIRYFVGLGTTDHSLMAAQALKETGTALITPTASGDNLLSKKGRIIMIHPRNTDIARSLVTHLKRRNIKKVVTIYASNSEYSKHMAKSFETQLTQSGGELVGSFSVRSGRISLAGIVPKLKKLTYSYIFLPIFELDVAKVIVELKRLGVDAPFLGTDAWMVYSSVISKLVRKHNMKAFVPVIYNGAFTTPTNQRFVKRFHELEGEIPSDLAAFSYDAVVLATQMHRQCSSKQFRESLEQCLTKSLPLESTTGPLKRADGLAIDRPIVIERVNLDSAA